MKPLPRMPEIPPVTGPVAPRGSEPSRDEDEIDLVELLGTMVEGRWLILAATALLTILGAVYAFAATPVYKADSLVQVEEKKNGLAGMKELSDVFADGSSSDAEIELIRSRSIVSQVVEKLHLDIRVEPKFFPVVGQALHRRHRPKTLASPWLGFSSYAWGGERLSVTRLEVPPELFDETLTLVAGEERAFKLLGPDGEVALSGTAGEAAKQADLGEGEAGLEVFVSELVARPGTEFTLRKRPRVAAIGDFLGKLAVAEKGKKTGILRLEFQSPDVEVARTALDEVMSAYVRRNVARKAEEAGKTLEFITAQLPDQKASLDAAEVKLNEYRKKTGKLDLGIEAQSIVTRSAGVAKAVTDLALQKSELQQRYTSEHPAIVALEKKLEQLNREKQGLETQAKTLPETELNSVRLVRDVTVANELYVLLLNKAQELKVVKSGTIGNVLVVDAAVVQPQPVSPKKALALALSLLLGLGLGIALTFMRKALNRGVDDPDVLEQALGLPVYASLPYSAKQAAMTKASKRDSGKLLPLAKVDNADLAMEALRSLRTSLQFSLASAKNNVILIGGSRPGVGKSFVSINLAHVLVDSGKRVLLIDGDIRKGRLHKYFDQKREGGLSELIGEPKGGEALVRETGVPNLHFLSSGTIPPNPSELLASDRFTEALAKLSSKYDLVLMDGPPVLAVTDAALLARAAGLNLLVLKHGLHPLREIALAVSRLQHSGAKPNGFIINAIPLLDRMYGHGKYRYHYQYDYR